MAGEGGGGSCNMYRVFSCHLPDNFEDARVKNWREGRRSIF